MKKPPLPKEVLEFFRKSGSIGGKKRAENLSFEELSAIGKKGGRPKGGLKKVAGKRGAK